ncbi:MAG: hypothetical protein ACREQ5_13205, partial [Candidatus Dormibacteria bacterium]
LKGSTAGAKPRCRVGSNAHRRLAPARQPLIWIKTPTSYLITVVRQRPSFTSINFFVMSVETARHRHSVNVSGAVINHQLAIIRGTEQHAEPHSQTPCTIPGR